MSERYFLKYRDTAIGKIIIDDNGRKSYESIKEVADTLPLHNGYPFGLYPIKSNGLFAPDKTHKPTEKDIDLWISERVFPSNRQGVSDLLYNLGVKEYDPWGIIVKTKGVSLHDDYWVTKDLEEEYKSVSIRHKTFRDIPPNMRSKKQYVMRALATVNFNRRLNLSRKTMVKEKSEIKEYDVTKSKSFEKHSQ